MLISSHRIRISCIAGRFFTIWATREALVNINVWYIWKLLRELILKVLITRKKIFLTVWDDGYYLILWWWSFYNIYACQITVLYNLDNAVCQLYLNKTLKKNFLDVTLWFLMYVTLCWHWPWGNLIIYKVFSRFC